MRTFADLSIASQRFLLLLLFVCEAACGQSAAAQELFSQWKLPAEVSATTGRNRVLIPAGKHGLNYFPDEVICILKDEPLTFTVVADGTYVMQGRSFETAVPVGHVLKPGPSGSPDNHYAGIGGIFDDKARKRVMGFYHAEDKEGIGIVEVNGVQGFYGTICAAEASLNDKTFRKLGPAITADKPKLPKGWETEGGPKAAWMAQGVGEPTVCVDATGKYLFCHFVEWSNRLKRGVQICVARCPIETAGVPGSWQKYHDGKFSEPGLGGHETPVISAGHQADTYNPHVQYVKEWERYVMVFGVGVQSEIHSRPLKAVQSGLYVTTSKDGVNWAKPVQIEKVFAFVINTQECKVHPTLIVSRVSEDTLTGQLLYGYTPRWPETPHHLGSCPISVKLQGSEQQHETATTFTSVRLTVSENGAGVLTVDSRPADETKQPEASSSESASLKVFGKATVSKLKDGRLDVTYDFKKVTEIADVIPSFVPPPARTALEKQLSIDSDEGVLVLIPDENKRIQLPFSRMIRPPFEMQVDLIGHSDGLLQLTAAPGNYLLGVSLHGENSPEEGVEPSTIAVFERPAPKEQFKTLLKIAHRSSEQREYRFRVNADAIQRNTMLSIGYLSELPLAIRRIRVTAGFPASFGMGVEQRGNRVMVTQVLDNGAAEGAGVKKGDILLAVDGKAVADSATALNLLAECEIGSPVKLSVLRFGKRQEIEVTPK